MRQPSVAGQSGDWRSQTTVRRWRASRPRSIHTGACAKTSIPPLRPQIPLRIALTRRTRFRRPLKTLSFSIIHLFKLSTFDARQMIVDPPSEPIIYYHSRAQNCDVAATVYCHHPASLALRRGGPSTVSPFAIPQKSLISGHAPGTPISRLASGKRVHLRGQSSDVRSVRIEYLPSNSCRDSNICPSLANQEIGAPRSPPITYHTLRFPHCTTGNSLTVFVTTATLTHPKPK